MNKILTKEKFEKAKSYIYKKARPLDIAIFEFEFAGGPISKVHNELVKMQNEDAGFGYGMEPDIRMPLSSNIPTTYAFQYLEMLGLKELPDYMHKALGYFNMTYKRDHKQWFPVTKDVINYPHAPWWEYDERSYIKDENWGNPTVEIIGYILKYKNSFDKAELKDLLDKALDRMLNLKNIETHELQCYARFLDCIENSEIVKSDDKDEQKAFQKKLKEVMKKMQKRVVKTVQKNAAKWVGYVTMPSAFVSSPNSRYLPVLKDIFEFELDYIINKQGLNGSWSPSWKWPTYIETWNQIKPEISAMLTVKNLILLKRFGRIEM